MKRLLKILKWIGIILLALIIILLIVRFIGKKIYNKTPDGGINETMYIDVNGQEQWLNIYGEDKDNLVMLYLHGGPGNSSSFGDWIILRKLAKDYTVVNWDQRDSGKTLIHDPKDTEITPELMRSDIDVVADYALDYMKKEKLTILGMSWGTMYGGDYALRHPEKTECVIELSLADDIILQRTIIKAMREYANGSKDFQSIVDEYGYDVFFQTLNLSDEPELYELIRVQQEGKSRSYLEWTENEPKYRKLAEQINSENYLAWYMDQDNPQLRDLCMEEYKKYELPLLEKYSDKLKAGESFFDTDINLITAVFFNPYYTLGDWFKFSYDSPKYYTAMSSLFENFTLENRTEYEMPFYVLESNRDENDIGGCMKQYFDSVSAPDKDFRYIDGTHMSTLLHSEELARFVHEICGKLQPA